MALDVSVGGVRQLGPGIWQTELSPRDVRSLGTGLSSSGAISVVLLDKLQRDDKETLRFSPHAANVLNVGNTPRTIFIAANETSGGSERAKPVQAKPIVNSSELGRGDKEYLSALHELPEQVRIAGEVLLQRVRGHIPGDLRRISHRRYQETPDNFWFVRIQPRDKSISVTVRGLPNRFNVSKLKIVADRRPYSRFKINHISEVDEAIHVILGAIRKL
ncbi:MAG TPA: hypothetical protein VGR52_05850 [Stellaceae bacterium]|nr:hypothetical protein [Stellaceae bacterium]